MTFFKTPRAYGKTHALIMSLPAIPDKPIIWIVYNKDMVKYTENLFKELRGEEYLTEFVKVVARENSSRMNGSIFFDPTLYDMLGNGLT